MGHIILVDRGEDGTGNGLILRQFSTDPVPLDERPIWKTPQNQFRYKYRPGYVGMVTSWFLTDEAHSLIEGPYTLHYKDYQWIIDIEDSKSAVLFKLIYG